MVKKMRNEQVIAVMNGLGDDVGKRLRGKKLPTKIVYALRRSTPEIEKAYKAYFETLQDTCARFGAELPAVRAEPIKAADPEQQNELNGALIELLQTETEVSIHTIPRDVIEDYDDSRYDELSFADLDRLWWMMEDEGVQKEDDGNRTDERPM